jgi:hypothetical protein
MVATNVNDRIQAEIDRKSNSYDLYHAFMSGMEMTTAIKCLNTYKKFNCRLNFPLCDPDTGDTYPVCLSDCTNSHVFCGLDATGCSDGITFVNVAEDDNSCKY